MIFDKALEGLGQLAPPLPDRNSKRCPPGTATMLPKRPSTASTGISRTRSPGSPRPGHARQATISRSQLSLTTVLVTTSPESYRISNPSVHQRLSLSSTAPWHSNYRLWNSRLAALGGAAEIGDRGFVTALVAPDLGQQPLADGGRDGLPALAGWLGETGK